MHPEAVFLPPAAMGDVVSASQRYRPHAIGLVDGRFLDTLSVFHKELLYAMDNGAWVLGASSLGALRAAECAAYGMIGVGIVFTKLQRGEIVDDDEVALSHADADNGFVALSDALVTIRATLAAARGAGLIGEDEEARLVDAQKSRWFPDRSLSFVAQDALALGMSEDRVTVLKHFVTTSVVDPKRSDAIEMLEAMRALPDGPPPTAPGTYLSGTFRALLARDVSVRGRAGGTSSQDRIRRYSALNDPDFARITRAARRRRALAAVAVHLAGPPTEAEIETARVAIAEAWGVLPEELAEEATRYDLDPRGLTELIESEALVLRMEDSYLTRSHQGTASLAYATELRLSGRYEAVRDAAALQERAARLVTPGSPIPIGRLAATQAAISAWQIPRPVKDYVDAYELGSVGELRESLAESVRAHQALFSTALAAGEVDDTPWLDDPEPPMPRGR